MLHQPLQTSRQGWEHRLSLCAWCLPGCSELLSVVSQRWKAWLPASAWNKTCSAHTHSQWNKRTKTASTCQSQTTKVTSSAGEIPAFRIKHSPTLSKPICCRWLLQKSQELRQVLLCGCAGGNGHTDTVKTCFGVSYGVGHSHKAEKAPVKSHALTLEGWNVNAVFLWLDNAMSHRRGRGTRGHQNADELSWLQITWGNQG